MIDHIAFIVENPQKTAALLEKFGYRIVRETPHHAGSIEMVDLRQAEIIIEICTKRPQEKLGVEHVCLKLDSREEYREIVKSGLTFSGKLKYIPESGRYVNNHFDDDNLKWQVTLDGKEF